MLMIVGWLGAATAVTCTSLPALLSPAAFVSVQLTANDPAALGATKVTDGPAAVGGVPAPRLQAYVIPARGLTLATFTVLTVTVAGAVTIGAMAAGTTLTVASPAGALSPAPFVSVQTSPVDPTVPEVNWTELILPSAEVTPAAPPALTMEPKLMAHVYVEPVCVCTDAVYVRLAVA
jgi:hypothetical protein